VTVSDGDEKSISRPSIGVPHLQQGDVLTLASIPIVAHEGTVSTVATPLGVVIISQTCDLQRPEPECISVAPVVELQGDLAGLAKSGRISRFLVLPGAGQNHFADLGVVASVGKAHAGSLEHIVGLEPEGAEQFRQAVGRRYTRFPFPDAVVPWFSPLSTLAQSKSPKPTSPEGWAFSRVVSLRVEAIDGWSTPPYVLRLLVVVAGEEMPPLSAADELPRPLSQAVQSQIFDSQGNRVGAHRLAELLTSEGTNADDRVHLWQYLGEAWVARCHPSDKDLKKLPPDVADEIRTAVAGGEIDVEVLTERDLAVDRYLRSAALDLDHLSLPLPDMVVPKASRPLFGRRPSGSDQSIVRQSWISRALATFRR
jgi:hypothetical protein